jgi:serine/threonine protein phosphatase PrpC
VELSLDIHAISDRGPVRERNEDRCGAFVPESPATRAERGRLFVVADGMGGHAAGDVAATLVLESLPAAYYRGPWLGAEATLRVAIGTAAEAIQREAARTPARGDMGATLVAAAIVGDRAVVAHVGDCRAYCVSAGVGRRLTLDHTWVQEQIAAGRLTEQEAHAHPYRSYVTRALSAESVAQADVGEWALERGDVLLLCSDGVCDVVPDDELDGILAAGDAARGARALVDWALAAGAVDNVSAIVVRVAGA